MSCIAVPELAFPFPFSILTSAITIGLLIANFMKNQTEFLIALLTLTDIVLKLNWCFLLPYLVLGSYRVSSLVIAYCLFMNLVTNFWLWRSSFGNRRLWYDPQFETYREKFSCLARLLLFSSYLLSFHIFRLSYSRLFGKKCFDARFKRRDTLRRLLT